MAPYSTVLIHKYYVADEFKKVIKLDLTPQEHERRDGIL